MRRFLLLAVAFVALATTAVRPVDAYDGYGYGYGLWSWSYASAYGRLPYRTGNLPTPPYFALHPPVYYSGVIVRRPYGDSPFAYGPQRPIHTVYVQAPTAASEPKVIENPYFNGAAETPAPAESPAASATAPATSARMIINPYYKAPSKAVASATR